jgi:hypothetical protein
MPVMSLALDFFLHFERFRPVSLQLQNKVLDNNEQNELLK